MLNHFHSSAHFILPGFVILSMVLFRLASQERRSVLFSSKIFALSIIGVYVSNFLVSYGLPEGNFVRSLSLFFEGAAIIALLGVAIFRVGLPSLSLPSPRILQDVIVAGFQIIWGLYLLQTQGVNLNGLIATSAVLTAVIGFSMQDTLGNILGGLAIQIDESIRVGDWIEMEGTMGKVVETSWRFTAIETPNWETLFIPNSVLMKTKFLVLARRRGEAKYWRRNIPFNVDYRHHPTQVIDAVESALRGTEIPMVAKEPHPQCLFLEFTESYGKYVTRYWLTDPGLDLPTDSRVRTTIFSALQRAGIVHSMPAYAVFLTQESEERKAGKAAQELAKRRSCLKSVELFGSLKPAELEELVAKLVWTPFSPGEVMTRQGAEAHWLYIIHEGTADITVQNATGETKKVTSLGPGNFFGEMGLMTGEPRHATVTATSAIISYRLDKESFRDIICSRPQIAEEISSVLAKRRLVLDQVKVNLDAESKNKHLSTTQSDILGKIRAFFGLER